MAVIHGQDASSPKSGSDFPALRSTASISFCALDWIPGLRDMARTNVLKAETTWAAYEHDVDVEEVYILTYSR